MCIRDSPDIVLVGEMRDLETIRLALTAAETGHLVFGTLHTSSAAKTIDRIVDVFPAAEKEMVRAMLSESLRAVISQTPVSYTHLDVYKRQMLFSSRRIFATSKRSEMQRENEWMSMSEGSTGTMMASALRVSSGKSRGGTAAGVSMTTCAASSGTRSCQERVTRTLRSNVVTPWMWACSGRRFFNQRLLEP